MILVMAQFLICGKNTNMLLRCKDRRPLAQVQGQKAIGERLWCNFVVFTNRGISIERINYDPNYWTNELLPKLESFFDNCLAPEVSPVHALGLPIRDLSKLN